MCIWKAPQTERPSQSLQHKIQGGPSKPEVTRYTTRKPDNVGCPRPGYTITWKAASAGGLCLYVREARQSGRPDAAIQGKIHGGKAMPEAVLYTTGKPVYAGGPLRRFA